MNRLLSADHHSEQIGLPSVVEELLADVVADGFTLYCCGPKTAPNALVAAYEWPHHVDLLTVQDFHRVITARVPIQGRTVDIFDPEVVVWAYEGPPQQALGALLGLVHPTHPDAPTGEYPAPAGLHVQRARQRPMTIQPPSPGHAGVRAARLAATVPTHRADRSGLHRGARRDTPPPRLPAGRRLSPAAPDAGLPAASRPPTPHP